ncbi:NAD/NADP-dependent octopine/nopaline dehydrogenase family protein [Alteribacillus sp. YIM 98480]|uniref:NAD/NADP octopine/nopaline dehydrogenase family protein n=1 Tax=Alteribacillus sp. YIM 98480 TaxID=2606599 RepID=UPI00131E8672|nr:NAD/NADP-dependent octopine/nopaline dehydrogenase family protein [Alteribacillus sp. YIM 98480]
MKKIAVLGGGNGAHALAAEQSLNGNEVRLFELERFRHCIDKVFETKEINVIGDVIEGKASISVVTSNIRKAISGAEIVFIPLPAFTHKEYAELLAPHVEPGQIYILLPGSLGTLEFAHIWGNKGITKDIILAEADTLPYVTRIDTPGNIRIYGKTTVQLGVFPSNKTEETVNKLEGILDVTPAQNVLEAGLNSINPVIHPPGTILNAGRIERSKGEFYIYEEGMSPSVTKIIDMLDEERRSIGEAFHLKLPPISEALHEGGLSPKGSTWEALNGSQMLTPVKGPTHLKSRYLGEDIPYGLTTWSSLGDVLGIDTPIIDSMITLGMAFLDMEPNDITRTLSSFGLEKLSSQETIQYVTEGRL